ncbi:DUF3667 domain-containing protein [Flavobacterium humi]|uniref:DUF3667 domain-containing protein n=1 Tax=Flavobacterium humi TaxID=2562683 RepID=A0A4Z0LD63_9FLAO|nr:DUF3667 domain-containing protein [Flavobacterium humi]TGD59821.1 DUF3667 domain-containing protein [Flavobacterium humi]
MSHSSHCLNCHQEVLGKFCYDCGQKTDTHRITFKHFVLHDILHGVWHFEKGILFTIKEALIRPGKGSLDYISGKRVKYYNVFYLLLVLIGLNIFLSHYYDVFSSKYLNIVFEKESDESELDRFLSEHAKLIIFSIVPLFALNSFLVFRRKRLNFSEHFIIAGMVYLGVILLVTLTEILSFLDFFKYIDVVSKFSSLLISFAIMAYVPFAYYNAFHSDYSKRRFLFNMCLFGFLLMVEITFFATLGILYIDK